MAAKFITKAELKHYDFSDFEHQYLFNIANEKDENGYNGRYLSTWYFEMRHDDAARKAITDMIWSLILCYFKAHAYEYSYGYMSQLSLQGVATFVADKLNTWSGEIIRWMKGMEWGRTYDMDVCDHWGLDTCTIFVNK